MPLYLLHCYKAPTITIESDTELMHLNTPQQLRDIFFVLRNLLCQNGYLLAHHGFCSNPKSLFPTMTHNNNNSNFEHFMIINGQ